MAASAPRIVTSILIGALVSASLAHAHAAEPPTDLVIPAGETSMTIDVLRAGGNLMVQGTLTLLSSNDVTLEVSGDVVVEGLVRVVTVPSDREPGSDGASITIHARSIHVGPKGVIAAEDGADGRAVMDAAGVVSAGAGGAGGIIDLDAPQLKLEGALLPGAGGRGGDAWAFRGADAVGGAGGKSGWAQTSRGGEVELLAGANGGDGGRATSSGSGYDVTWTPPAMPKMACDIKHGCGLLGQGPIMPDRLCVERMCFVVNPPDCDACGDDEDPGELDLEGAAESLVEEGDLPRDQLFFPSLGPPGQPGAPGTCIGQPAGADGETGIGRDGGAGGSGSNCGRDGAAGADGPDGDNGLFYCSEGGPGGAGSGGENAGAATGGAGGAGIGGNGGRGGDATAYGGQGGAGGQGGDGGTSMLGRCSGGAGGTGGPGGLGGAASGGKGGDAVCGYGGEGGNGVSSGGAGGAGGAGGGGKPAGPAGLPGPAGTPGTFHGGAGGSSFPCAPTSQVG